MNEFFESFHGLYERMMDLKKGLIMLSIILALTGLAHLFDDFQGVSRLAVVLTILGFVAVAIFNVHIVPLIAYKEAWKWNFLLLVFPICVAGMCFIGFAFSYVPMSLFNFGSLITFIRLVTYKSPIRLGR